MPRRSELSAPRLSGNGPTLLLLLGLLCLSTMAAAVDVHLDGEPIQGGLIIGRTDPGASVFLDGDPLRVSSDGIFLIGFGRDAADRASLSVRGPEGDAWEQTLQVTAREYDIQRIDGLPQEQVTPPPEVLDRIREDGRLVREARARDDDRQDFLGGFRWPAFGPISGVYGSQRILNGEPRRPHFGVDVAAPEGTPVFAPAAGVVTLSHPDMYYSGGTIIIDHGQQLSSTFLHLSAIEVQVGEVVRMGDLIGRIGATGRVTGAHLDWRMNLGPVRLDPELLVGPMPAQEQD